MRAVTTSDGTPDAWLRRDWEKSYLTHTDGKTFAGEGFRWAEPVQRECSDGLTHIESAPVADTVEERPPKNAKGAAAMNEQAIHYLALDVHQATTVASVRDAQGRVVMPV